MALPKMTDEQRANALEKAKETRRKRAEVRAKIKAGKLTAKKALAKRDDPIIGKIKASARPRPRRSWQRSASPRTAVCPAWVTSRSPLSSKRSARNQLDTYRAIEEALRGLLFFVFRIESDRKLSEWEIFLTENK